MREAAKVIHEIGMTSGYNDKLEILRRNADVPGLKEILKFNDLKQEQELLPGTVVYLQKKKKASHPGLDRYVVEDGQTLREISQRFAVRMKNLCRLNGIEENHSLREGDVLQLR